MLINLAISILWLAIGIIIILGAVYLFFMCIELYYPIPEKVKQAVWLIVVILCLIAALTMLAGGGTFHSPFHLGYNFTGPAVATG